MPIEFHKMHGAGNDFVLVDARTGPFSLDPAGAARIADRHCGVGCDQILILRPSARDGCLLRYEIWNADGSPAAQCGNGARCVALYLERSGADLQQPLQVESPAGPVELVRCRDGEYEVTMGVPEFAAERIPLRLPGDGRHYRLDSPWGPLEFGAASMGNPHALLLVDERSRTSAVTSTATRPFRTAATSVSPGSRARPAFVCASSNAAPARPLPAVRALAPRWPSCDAGAASMTAWRSRFPADVL
jgi:diaminopimelate epimerase